MRSSAFADANESLDPDILVEVPVCRIAWGSHGLLVVMILFHSSSGRALTWPM